MLIEVRWEFRVVWEDLASQFSLPGLLGVSLLWLLSEPHLPPPQFCSLLGWTVRRSSSSHSALTFFFCLIDISPATDSSQWYYSLLTYSLICPIFTEHLICARQCIKCWAHKASRVDPPPVCPPKGLVLGEKHRVTRQLLECTVANQDHCDRGKIPKGGGT